MNGIWQLVTLLTLISQLSRWKHRVLWGFDVAVNQFLRILASEDHWLRDFTSILGPWWCPSENFGMVWIRWLDWWKHNKFTLDWWKEIFSSCYSHASRISFLLTAGSSYKGICATWSTFLLPPFVDPEVGHPPEMEQQSQRQGASQWKTMSE